ncbi:hypothetical protein M409DRAFT_16570 [Zasmidium cellare ATCC 36951]|uniref:FAD-binding PCMH-type domain-containing protein n=1 Tax=Zasmidium cellare ATCC 36951 TaxID=1080233 RepID=A0A6A6CZE6_ZASCE|nr:uncharacterized protein M409DRAFT_16570 [Zasmidium cellare ATCC 36951]KAF2172607.1 hypothetical protein M409DRAFT_16570 [Zasmidium cellare ATCC 36951]
MYFSFSWLWWVAAVVPQVAAFPLNDFSEAATTNYSAIYSPCLSKGAHIYYPYQANYNTSVLQRASTWDSPTFAVTVKPACNSDVQCVVKQSNKNNIKFFATGGGHGAEPGFATVQNAANIDLSGFTQNVLDTAANRLTVGPGVSFVDFETNLYNAGKLVPVGNIYCVNMIGATIGAGIGPYQGLHGLVIDALRSVTLITAAGDIVTASSSQNSDLFWAVKGAGANFGIITSATYEIFDAPNAGNLVEADFVYPPTANVSVFKLLQSMDKTYPKEMGMTIVLGYNHTINSSTLGVTFSYFGTPAQAKPVVDQFVALKPVRWQNQTIPWSQLSQKQGFGASGPAACIRQLWNNHYSVGTKQTDPATYTSVFNSFNAWAKGKTWYNGNIAIQRFNTNVTLSVPTEQQGVYPGREIGTIIVINNFYDGPAHDEAVYQFSRPIRSQLAATSGFSNLTTYINYAFGDEGPNVWYGQSHLPRLVATKKKWDPQYKFGPGNPIPTSA